MSAGKDCPSCDRDIGIWSVFSAGLPTRIRCPHCRTLLSYSGATALGITMVALAVVVGVASYFAARALASEGNWYLPFVAILLAAWVPIELAMTAYLRARATLRVAGG